MEIGPDEEMPVAAVYGYESIMVLADALRRSASTDAADLQKALSETAITDHVLPQATIRFDGTGEGVESAGVLIQIQNGKQVIVYPRAYAESEYRPKNGETP